LPYPVPGYDYPPRRTSDFLFVGVRSRKRLARAGKPMKESGMAGSAEIGVIRYFAFIEATFLI